MARRLHALMLRVYRKACSQIGWWYWGCVDRAARKARFELARRSAIKIQAHIRKYLAIKYVIWRRKAYNDAALRLQVRSRPVAECGCLQHHLRTVASVCGC